MKRPYTIGINGGTCSGKSTLTNTLYEKLGKRYKTCVICMDDYYNWGEMKTISPITRIEYPEHNHPDAIDISKLNEDFMSSISVTTNDIVIIEGVFSLYFNVIRERLDLKIFIDLKSDERLYRRIKRMIDCESLEEIACRYLDTVRYRHDEFVEPLRWHADIILNGTLDANLGVSVIASYIETRI